MWVGFSLLPHPMSRKAAALTGRSGGFAALATQLEKGTSWATQSRRLFCGARQLSP